MGRAKASGWAAVVAAAGLVGAAEAAPVTVQVSNVGPKGALYALLCTEKEYGKRCALSQQAAPQVGGTAVVFPQVPPGAYVASVFQDVDGDHRLSFGMMGGPSEPWGYSRAAKAVFGPAAFKDAVVTVGPGPTAIPVRLRR